MMIKAMKNLILLVAMTLISFNLQADSKWDACYNYAQEAHRIMTLRQSGTSLDALLAKPENQSSNARSLLKRAFERPYSSTGKSLSATSFRDSVAYHCLNETSKREVQAGSPENICITVSKDAYRAMTLRQSGRSLDELLSKPENSAVRTRNLLESAFDWPYSSTPERKESVAVIFRNTNTYHCMRAMRELGW